LPNSDDVVLCFEYSTYQNTNTLTIDLTQINSYKNKTIIVKNANVILTNSMETEDNYLDLFVDNGNVILQNNATNLQWFD
jgi:predicted RNA-binding protein with PIN domain